MHRSRRVPVPSLLAVAALLVSSACSGGSAPGTAFSPGAIPAATSADLRADAEASGTRPSGASDSGGLLEPWEFAAVTTATAEDIPVAAIAPDLVPDTPLAGDYKGVVEGTTSTEKRQGGITFTMSLSGNDVSGHGTIVSGEKSLNFTLTGTVTRYPYSWGIAMSLHGGFDCEAKGWARKYPKNMFGVVDAPGCGADPKAIRYVFKVHRMPA